MIGFVAVVVAICRGKNVPLAFSFMSIVVIQLYEAFLYKYCKNARASSTLREFLKWTICLQPILLSVGAVLSTPHNFHPYVCIGLVVAYVIALMWELPTIEATQTCGKWRFATFNLMAGILYHLALFLSLLLPQRGVLLFSAGLLVCLASLFMGENYPSKWCLLASIVSVFLNFD